MAFHAGYNAQVQIDDVVFCAIRWSVNESVEDLDTTNFCGDGYATRIRGIRQAEITIEMNWDETNNFNMTPPNAQVGEKVNIELFPDFDSNPTDQYSFTSVLVTGINFDVDVRGLVKTTLTGMSDGSYSIPVV